jgi:homoserine dehydrogenase
LPSWKTLLQDEGKRYTSFDEITEYLGSATLPVLVIDCTASDHIPSHYLTLLQKGIHIATPNKKGVSGSLQLFDNIMRSALSSKVQFYYEATVGAGLPIISTLQDLVQSGDQVLKIEGVFSGTLSYIFNVFGNGTAKFSEVVKEAKEKGYTEPDPRDDLNGMDVARKLTILARTIGMEIDGPPSSSIFPIQSLIPDALKSARSGDEFMAGLPTHDDEFDEKRAAAKKDGNVLRYVGSIDVVRKDIKVGLQLYFPCHLSHIDIRLHIHLPDYRDLIILLHFILKGMEVDHSLFKEPGNSLSYKTYDRAGAEVTAMGVFSDIFKFNERA